MVSVGVPTVDAILTVRAEPIPILAVLIHPTADESIAYNMNCSFPKALTAIGSATNYNTVVVIFDPREVTIV
jgi:hypothetical protein